MTQQQIIPVRFLYRSEGMIPMLTVMERAGIWEKYGIDVRDFRYSPEALDAEEQLLDGGIDFIFGNHVSPYMRLAHGEDIVCLAQTENWQHEWVATSPEIRELPMLHGKRAVGLPLFLANGKFSGHSDGNRILLLELEGVDTRTVEFLPPDQVGGNAIEAVKNGKAEACFISPRNAARAEEAGLIVHRTLPMPMVHNITYTTTYNRLGQQSDFGERIIKILVEATAFYKTRQDEAKDMIKDPVDKMRPGQIERLVAHFDESCAEHETKPYPRPEALINVHKLACMVYPEAKSVNPLELWDTSILRSIHASGFVDNLYGGAPRVLEHVEHTIDVGTHMDDC
ncbi:MAG: transporter, phosphonate, periplasmic substrate-binding protein [Chloroflexota bacterium]|jgi:hypothetical protein|nr:transporter, phosphonate, periplasmic substrate-binding protein [Chloroflexota bacterium]